MRLCDVTNQDIADYQRARSDGRRPFKHTRSADHINEEVGKPGKDPCSGLWKALEDNYEPLEVRYSEPRRVMTKQEEAHLFKVAASRLEFALVYAYAVLSVSTSASGCELRGLRLIDIDLIGRTLQINADSVKNAARVRTIPLVDDAFWAASFLVKRAKQLGATGPYDFLFPYKRGKAPYDPRKHISDNGIQKRWHALRAAAEMPWLTLHVLRYQCITKLAEGNVDRASAKRIAGHITDDMWDKYSQVRIEAVREKMTEAFKSSSLAPGAGQVIAFPGVR